MNAVIAHTDPSVRKALADVLAEIGWNVSAEPTADAALEACRLTDADVLFVGDGEGAAAAEVLDRVKRDPDLYRTAVVMLGEDLATDEVVEWIARGADDVLRLPPQPADVIGRAAAASRTKALVKELTHQNQRLEEAVLFDELTGLRNRRAILHELEMLLAGARRHDRRISVLMLDVDRFKAINDRHGHRTGDDVLRAVAARLLDRLRTEDLAGRLGGDELVVVLPDTDAEGAAVAAESIRAAIGDTHVEAAGGPVEVTVSIGSACWQGEPLNALLERADGALYAAKAAGRDAAAAA